MALILSLDTSTKVCSIAVHEDGNLLGVQTYHLQKSHSTLLPVIIEQLMTNLELELHQLNAIALSAGPGSYTGLRIGTSTVKGLTFALDIPLIAVGGLEAMVLQIEPMVPKGMVLFPMIDARRMEVFTLAKKASSELIWKPRPLIVDEHTFNEFNEEQLCFFGNGSDKFRDMFKKAKFISGIYPSAEFMGILAYQKFLKEQFEDVAYYEPDYLKEYRTNVPSQKFKV